MSAGHTYKTIDLVGTSSDSVEEAVQSAVSRASETLQGLDWFEVGDIRGQIVDGKVAWYQVSLKIGFRVMEAGDLKTD